MKQESALSQFELHYEYTYDESYTAFMRIIGAHRAVKRAVANRSLVKLIGKSVKLISKSWTRTHPDN